ncbi:hypothetical protein EUZ85_15085 [Hahella sp. KA22]|uniref:hypothetical protein n=1 Tax=Hahella sp. KA22 TaxID=1628392 RepID=UPI000FDF4AEA|nr:hypothetical protein [Hahella sp. KA22]AZZ91984.1 hypothetical protein ENC22_12520 [Hahella sp. KA22]QAY55355.1 hypothetical protein EUZ85_15085 [Hahella sp. KA22]
MNTMKNFRLAFFTSTLFLSLTACAQQSFDWRYDGSVVSNGVTISTELQNAYSAFETPNGIYLAGFKIDKDSVNYPYIVFVGSSLKEKRSWPLTAMVEQFFEYESDLYIVDSEGSAFQLDGNDWKLTDLTFKPDSIIVSTSQDIIACNPTPMAKVANGTGSCYSVFKKWSVNANWRNTPPKVCNGVLIIQERKAGALRYLAIDTASGKLLKSLSTKEVVSDLCLVGF